MNRRTFFVSTVAFLAAGPALAQNDAGTEAILRQLRAQGYSDIDISRTWLGRVRILAKSPDTTREIVYNPSTGALMRDHAYESVNAVGPDPAPRIIDRRERQRAEGGRGREGAGRAHDDSGGAGHGNPGSGASGGGRGNAGGGSGKGRDEKGQGGGRSNGNGRGGND
ncbi:hypothetical protein [Citreimonas salinaria]|uniref:Peptidase propeptide and YPEB domain-containing protein n=1 Tax=Citreimonas salinaria TaxID=321339 RepID=A0A1H3NPM8_9RHOB|nr:hypothetical protein [Citreimonas salinaria]SDY90748.1 hypothetical protein SAMN05444340_1287 [Citreimonas salinaria]